MKTFEIPRRPAPAAQPTVEDGYESFRRIEPELAALVREEILHVNLSIPRACAVALAAVPRMMQLRPLVVEQLPRHPIETLDKLQDYALALYYMNAMCTRRRSDGSIQKLHAEVIALRTSLLIAAEALAHAGLFDARAIAEIRKGSGYQNMAEDLGALVMLFRTNWGAVKGKTAVVQEEVERAQRLGEELLAQRGVRMQPIRPRTEQDFQSDLRDRCFTLFMRSYTECRAVASYLRRHEGDAERFAPNLFTKAKTARRKKPSEGGSAQTSQEQVAETPKRTTKRAARGKRRRAP